MTPNPIKLAHVGCALALAAAGTLAQAAPVYTLAATSNTAGNAPPGSNVMPAGLASGGDFLSSFNGSTGSTFFHTYGFTNPAAYFGARVSGSGSAFYGKTSTNYQDSFTNTTGAALLVTFNFNVDSGQLALSGTGSGFADLDLVLRFNGTTVARDHTRVDGASCNSFAGQDVGVLAGYQTCIDGGNASGASHFYSVSQLLGIGQTLSIDYSIISEVSGTYTSGGSTYCSGGGNPAIATRGDTDVVGGQVPNQSGCQFFNVLARSGDPASFGTPPFTNANFNFSAVPAAVPEPGSLALATLALAALGGLHRRASRA